MNISNNIASIGAHQTLLNTSANNIANSNTDAYVPKDTRISNSAGSVVANTRLSDNTGSSKSQTNIAKEIPDLIVAQDTTALNVSAIKTEDEMLGALLDMKA